MFFCWKRHLVVLEKSIFLKISLESREKSLFFQRLEEPWEKVSRGGNFPGRPWPNYLLLWIHHILRIIINFVMMSVTCLLPQDLEMSANVRSPTRLIWQISSRECRVGRGGWRFPQVKIFSVHSVQSTIAAKFDLKSKSGCIIMKREVTLIVDV